MNPTDAEGPKGHLPCQNASRFGDAEGKTKIDSNVFQSDKTAPMGYKIKRIDDKPIAHKSEGKGVLNEGSNRIAICGSSGTGKSTLLLEILPLFSSNTTNILLCTSKPYDNSHTAIGNYCKSCNIKFHKLNDCLAIADAIQEIVEKKKDTEHFIVIFDDLSASNSTNMNDPINDLITTAYRVLRSFGGSLIMIVQSYYSLPTRVRENLTHRFIFQLGNIYSIRALLEDTCGLFFTGDNEKAVKRDINNIYKKVFNEPHGWILIKTMPPQITWKWATKLYPPTKETPNELDDAEGNFSTITGSGLANKRELYNQATALGFPKYMYTRCTSEQIKQYIEKASAIGEKEMGNTAPEINDVINEISDTSVLKGDKLIQKIMKLIHQFKKTEYNKYLKELELIISEALDANNLSVDRVKYILNTNHMNKFFDF